MRVLSALVVTSSSSLLAAATPPALVEALIVLVAVLGVCAIPGLALAFVVDVAGVFDDDWRQPRRDRLPRSVTPRAPLPPRLALVLP